MSRESIKAWGFIYLAHEKGPNMDFAIEPEGLWRVVLVMRLLLAAECEWPNNTPEEHNHEAIRAVVNVLRALKGLPLARALQWSLEFDGDVPLQLRNGEIAKHAKQGVLALSDLRYY